MVTLDETADAELQADISEEATAFGQLEDCMITVVYDTPDAAGTGTGTGTGGGGGEPVVFVYLTYGTYADACRARDAMHGKFFGDSGVRVVAQLVDADEVARRKKK